MAIYAISLDYNCLTSNAYFDSCLLDGSLLKKPTNEADNENDWNVRLGDSQFNTLTHYNSSLIEHLQKKTKAVKNAYLLNGSQRQDCETEIKRSTVSQWPVYSFYALAKFAGEIGARFDPFLIGDIKRKKAKKHSHLEAGACYKDFMQFFQGERETLPTYKCVGPNGLTDSSKISLIYAQVHKLANDHPGKKIEFDFFGDDNDIHSSINEFFKANSWLLPKNVQLNLHIYCDKNRRTNPQRKTWSPFDKPIQGTGFIDAAFDETVLEMLQSLKPNEYNGAQPLNETLNPKTLRKRKEKDLSTSDTRVTIKSFRDEYDTQEIVASVCTLGFYNLLKELVGDSKEYIGLKVALTTLLFLGTGGIAGIGAGIAVLAKKSNCFCCFFSNNQTVPDKQPSEFELDIQENHAHK